MESAGNLTPEEWHAWFAVQAGWTRSTRRWLYRQAGLERARTVLEVGCGTGVIAEELASLTSARVIGLDLDPAMLAFARRRPHRATYLQGDAHTLPFTGNSFDLVVCHYLLLWLEHPLRAVREMARVARPAGAVLACAEPDYGGRIDYPPALAPLGRMQAEALRRQGADPETGRRVGELFTAAGLQTTVGTMAGRWNRPISPGAGFEAEWAMRERDLIGLLPPEELHRFRSLDREALKDGRRILFVPTFYALGRRQIRNRQKAGS